METKFGKWITSKGFAKLFLVILAAAVCYMGLRAGDGAAWLWGWNLYVPIFAVLFVMLLLLAYSQRAGTGRRFDRICKQVSSCFLCFLLYDVLALIVFDLAGWVFSFSPVVRGRLVFGAALISVFLLLWGWVHARQLKTVRYTVDLGGQGGAARIVLLSDLHIGVFIGADYLEKAAAEVNRVQPEIVVIAGDLFDGCLPATDRELQQIAAVFRSIQAPGGVYAVTGNHDPGVDEPRFLQFFEDANIRLLYNETLELSQFYLVGRAGIVGMKDIRVPLDRLMPQAASGKPVVVLDHDPQGIREAISCGADLVLCGHTHRGQLFPMDFLTRWANGKEYFYGCNRAGKTQSIISAGTGFFQLPIRLGTDSEVVVIDCRM